MRLDERPVCARFWPVLEKLEQRVAPASTVIPLNNFGNQGATLRGFEDLASAGRSVAGAGDVNGDGFADVIVGAYRTSAGGTDRGEAYVVFGGPSLGGTIPTLNALGTGGFTLRGFQDNAKAGGSVAGAGDVNGDGFADLIVGATFASAGGTSRGEAYVIFGGPNLGGTTIALNALGTGGFTLRGYEDFSETATSVSGAGDVNGDGFADVIVGANEADAGGVNLGEAYVVFGGPNRAGTTVSLNALGTGGFTMRGVQTDAQVGRAVAGAGDVNGDGFDDLILGAYRTSAGGTNRGESYVVFGGSNRGGTTVTVNALGTGGFTLRGFEDNANAGVSVAGAGDVNGDGFADLIVGANKTDAGGTDRGEAYVVFGASAFGGAVVTLNALGTSGFTLRGFENSAFAGVSVGGGRDVNGDGFDDVVVGAFRTNAGGNDRGEVYVVFGGANRAGTTFPLNALGGGGFTLRGFADGATAGLSVSVAGNVNGDSFADVIVGAPFTSAGGASRGEAYVVLAPLPPAIAVGTGPGVTARVNVYDAKSGQIRASFLPYGTGFSGGVHVAQGDVNFDGAPDVITGPGPTGVPDVRVFDGRTFAIIADFFAYNAAFTGGVFVAAGDVNGDGKADIVTGPGAGGGPDLRVFSGANNSLLQEFFAYNGAFSGGVNVAAGDVNGDGKADIITGTGAGGGPHVRVFDGASPGSILKEFFAYSTTFTGGVNVAAGDVNGDGKADIITGAGAGGGPQVKVFSNAGALLQSFFAYTPGFTGGVTVAAEDVDGDGRADIITGAGAGGGPHVKAFRGTDIAPLRSFFAYDPSFLGGVFVG